MLKSVLLSTIFTVPYNMLNQAYDPVPDVCPGLFEGTPVSNYAATPTLEQYNDALSDLDIMSVIHDIQSLLTESQDCWPSDQFRSGSSYGPLFIRLAWHCSGTYRATDGAGGCAGGRQRFSPEASWEDNTSLDKARALLAPIKQKYGTALSWGDLMVFGGTASILNMGGPVSEICAGRIDDEDGTKSLILGPSKQAAPCPVPGDCPEPLGTEQIGLIYVNPEGFHGNPDPEQSAHQIRRIFARMGMNDRETVALIGGGHAFGKAHGACPDGAGLNPEEDPYNPWPGNCGTGRGRDTFTSGIEGPWTRNPLKWDNEFFTLLNDFGDKYILERGVGGKWQWKHPYYERLMMLTTDLALIYDEKYDEIVDEFAYDIDALNKEFAAAWAKLTSSGGGWSENRKCVHINQGLEDEDKKKEKEVGDKRYGTSSYWPLF